MAEIRNLQQLLRQVYGLSPNPGEDLQTTLNREILEKTESGLWVTIQVDGVTLGSLVEGSPVKIGPDRLAYPVPVHRCSPPVAEHV